MFPKALIIACFAACACFAVAANAQDAQNETTLYWSPVTLQYPGTGFSIEDAQNINYSIYDELGAQNVHVSVITAQLYLNGVPYNMSNVPITFSSDNDAVAVLEPNRTRPSDANGQAKILLIANNTAGLVNITAKSTIVPDHEVSDTCTVRVVGWGTVSGLVSDQNRNGIPKASVTLWHVKWNSTTSKWENTDQVKIMENPQFSNDGRTGPLGIYTFYHVPEDIYNVTAESEGHVYWAVFVLGPRPEGVDAYAGAPESAWPGSDFGTATHNIAIPDYSYTVPATPTPASSVSPTPAPSATSTPRPTPALPALLALGALAMAALMARKLT